MHPRAAARAVASSVESPEDIPRTKILLAGTVPATRPVEILVADWAAKNRPLWDQWDSVRVAVIVSWLAPRKIGL